MRNYIFVGKQSFLRMFFIAFLVSWVFQSSIHPFCNLNSAEYPQPQETKLYLSGVCPDSFSVFTYGAPKDLLYSTEYKLRTHNTHQMCKKSG